MEIQRYWAVIWKWLWLIILGIVVAGGMAYFLSQRMEPVYRATATLLVRESSNPTSVIQYSQPAVATHTELLKTHLVMGRVSSELAKLGIYYSPEELGVKISTQTKTYTPLIKVSAEDTDPAIAQQIANTTVGTYVQQYQASVVAEVQTSLSQIQSQIDTTSARIDELLLKRDTVGLTPEEEDELNTSPDNLEQLKGLRTLWSFQLIQAMAAGGISLAELASLPTSPVRPKITQNVLLASVLGLVVTTGGTFLKEWLDRSVRTDEDISRLTELSTLGAIAKFKATRGGKGGLITQAHSRSSVAEAFRMLSTNIQFATIDKPAQTILITSATPGEGKSSVLANLAVTIAQTGKKVIVVDADLRHPQIGKLFKVSNDTGFTDLLLTEQPHVADSLQLTEVEGLRILVSGTQPHYPVRLFSSARVSSLLDEMKKEADIILVDSAPILLAAETAILAAKVDGTILVVEAGDTKPEELTEAKKTLSKANVNILGAVLNKVEIGRGGYYYYRYHYYYGEDGEKKQHKRSESAATNQEEPLFSRLLKRFIRRR